MNAVFVRRAIVALLVMVVASLGALAYAFYALRTASADFDSVETQRVRAYQLTTELRQSSNDLTRMARSFVATGDPAYERQYYMVLDIRDGRALRPVDYHNIYWELITPANEMPPRPLTNEAIPLNTLLEEVGFTPQELALVEQSQRESNAQARLETVAMNMSQGRYQDAKGTFARIDTPNRPEAQRMLYDAVYDQRKVAIMKPLEQAINTFEQRATQQTDIARNVQNRAQYLFLGLMILSLGLIGALIYFGRKQGEMNLEERAAAQKKAEDENEQLNNSVINILQAVSAISQRDLTVKAPVTQDIIGTVSDSINLLTDETAKVLHGVTDIAGQVEQVSNKVKSQADLVSQTAESERESVAEMVESLFQTTQTMNQVAALAEQSNLSAEQATLVTNNALGTVNDTVKGMESIREQIAETEKRIKRLGERSQEISGIVALINTISERTHVLALNASMQAAVAGEAGRGFAVVAEEVQRLAESSRNATQQIATLVNNIQLETNETINTVNRTIGQVVEGSEQAQKAGEQMQRTQEITAQLVSQVRNIASASEQQKSMSANLLEAVQKIGESTNNTAQQIEAQNKETETLLMASRNLVESVNVFKLPAAAA